MGVKYFLLDVEIWQPKHRRSATSKASGSGGGGIAVSGNGSSQYHSHTPSNPFNVADGGNLGSPNALATDDNISIIEKRLQERHNKRRTESAASSATSSRTRSSVSQQPPPNLLSQSPGVTTTLTRALSEQQEHKQAEREARSPVSPVISESANASGNGNARDGRNGSISVTGAAQDLLRSSLKRQQQYSPN